MTTSSESTPLVVSTTKTTDNNKVIFTWESFVQDHTRFLVMLPAYFGAYVIPGRAIAPKDIETVMVTMNNSLSSCPYCAGLHGQLARMAGVSMQDAAEHDSSSNPYVIFSKTFALNGGRGHVVDEALKTLTEQLNNSTAMASSVNSLCWAMQWGKTTGNSINNARDKFKNFDELKSINLLDIILLVYYGPLFLVISIFNLILVKIPPVPSQVSTAIGAILWFPQMIFLTPMGLICFIVSGFKVV